MFLLHPRRQAAATSPCPEGCLPLPQRWTAAACSLVPCSVRARGEGGSVLVLLSILTLNQDVLLGSGVGPLQHPCTPSLSLAADNCLASLLALGKERFLPLLLLVPDPRTQGNPGLVAFASALPREAAELCLVTLAGWGEPFTGPNRFRFYPDSGSKRAWCPFPRSLREASLPSGGGSGKQQGLTPVQQQQVSHHHTRATNACCPTRHSGGHRGEACPELLASECGLRCVGGCRFSWTEGRAPT